MSECPWEEECQVWDLDSVQWVQVQVLVPGPWDLAGQARDRCNILEESLMVSMGCPRVTPVPDPWDQEARDRDRCNILGESRMVNTGCPRVTPVSPSNTPAWPPVGRASSNKI